jgi:hypothetical protein
VIAANIDEVMTRVAPIFKKQKCRVQVGLLKSLSLGFGEKLYNDKLPTRDKYYGEWEIGTWNCSAWRVLVGNSVQCGSNDTSDLEALDAAVASVEFGFITGFECLSKHDVRVSFSNNIFVDFLQATQDQDPDEDDVFHIFGPDHLYVQYIPANGWFIGKSTKNQK